jgi:hypothetical protein
MKRNDAALDRISKQLSADAERVRQRELRLTAHHEAGHALAHAILGSGRTIMVTLADNDDIVDAGGGSCYGRGFYGDHPQVIRKRMIVAAAGAAAQLRYDPKSDGGGRADNRTLRDLAVELCGRLASEQRIAREIKVARRRAERLVKLYWPQIETTAARFVENHLFLTMVQRRTIAQL